MYVLGGGVDEWMDRWMQQYHALESHECIMYDAGDEGITNYNTDILAE